MFLYWPGNTNGHCRYDTMAPGDADIFIVFTLSLREVENKHLDM